jgi:signal transduction histidine kinase
MLDEKFDNRWDRVREFTLTFNRYIEKTDGEVRVTKDGIKELKDYNAWIQILDEEGYEIYQWNKPKTALSHYTPSEMIFYNIYTGAINNYTTFAGTAEIDGYKWSYIIGFPMEEVAKYSYYYFPRRLNLNIIKAVVYLLVTPTIVILIMGYIFGRSLTKPVADIIHGIQQLSKGNYDVNYTEKGMYKDVYTNLNNLSNQLRLNKHEREKTEKMREEWINNLSHDLKTPLSSIKGYSELMADEDYSLTDYEIKEYSRIIKNKANYMEELLEDLKLTQVLKTGLFPMNTKSQDIVELLRGITIDVLNNPKYEKRKILFKIGREPIIFSFDKTLMQRAFTNLLYNSLVHNDEHTEIIINIDKKDKVYIEIEDDGKGIPEEDLDNLFERYYRGTDTGESHKGSGLGLSIAKQIIEIHGGTINVESILGVGTKFIVTFSQ